MFKKSHFYACAILSDFVRKSLPRFCTIDAISCFSAEILDCWMQPMQQISKYEYKCNNMQQICKHVLKL
jgi:hypothetical protein